MKSILEIFTQGTLIKILLMVCIVLAGVTVYHHQLLELKDVRIEKLEMANEVSQQKIADLSEQVGYLRKHSEEADKATRQLREKLITLDNKKTDYSEKVKELGNTNDKVKTILDTKLPDDLKRLLNESISGKD